MDCPPADGSRWSQPVAGHTDNHVVGMLSREDVISFLRTVQELGGVAGATSTRTLIKATH